MMKEAAVTLALLLVLALLGILYQQYLDTGCNIQGYMTWEGKQCIN